MGNCALTQEGARVLQTVSHRVGKFLSMRDFEGEKVKYQSFA